MMQTNEGMIAAGIWRGCDYSSYFGQDWDSPNNMDDRQVRFEQALEVEG